MARLSGEGVSLDLPPGWDGRIFRRAATAPETTHAVVHAANFALPPDTGDYGDGAVQAMGATSVLIALVEFHPDSTATSLFSAQGFPLPLRPEDATRSTLQRALPGQGGIQRFCSVAGRAWCVYVVLGNFDRRNDLVPLANDVLAKVDVQ